MKNIFYLLLITSLTGINAQVIKKDKKFSKEITQVVGDLNKDSINDKVIVIQDTVNEKRPYKLQVYFGQSNGDYKLFISTDKAICPQFPDGKSGADDENDPPEITIKKGILIISIQQLRGHYEHKYRFQNGNFELIGFSSVGYDGQGTISSIDFNLSAGIKIEKEESAATDKVISSSKKKILIRPLPWLGDFEPLENDEY